MMYVTGPNKVPRDAIKQVLRIFAKDHALVTLREWQEWRPTSSCRMELPPG